MAQAWPLVGRREELALVRDLLGRGESAGVVLAGAAGVGKTRLAAEALRAAEAGGCATFRVAATRAAATIPFGAFAQPLPPPGALPAGQLDFLRQAVRALGELAGNRRLVLSVDDAHLLDAGSATLVHQIVTSGRALVVVTVRAGEPALDPIVALWKERLTAYVELQALGRPEVDLLVSSASAPPMARARSWASRSRCRLLRCPERTGSRWSGGGQGSP